MGAMVTTPLPANGVETLQLQARDDRPFDPPHLVPSQHTPRVLLAYSYVSVSSREFLGEGLGGVAGKTAGGLTCRRLRSLPAQLSAAS